MTVATIIKREFELIVIFIGCSVVASIVAVLIGFVWDRMDNNNNNVDYALWVAFVLSVIGVFALSTYVDRLLKKLGRKSPISIFSGGGLAQGRRVPINYAGGKKSAVFLSSLPLIGRDSRQIDTEGKATLPPEIELPQTFTVILNGNVHTFTAIETRDFLSKAFARERAGSKGFSIRYWMQSHRPRWDRQRYDAMMKMLETNGLVVDRAERRSGRIVMPPNSAMKRLQSSI